MPGGTDPVQEFFRALNEADVDRLTAALHPEFEMVVPQKPARGFKGREQEVRNMTSLLDAYPDFSVRILRRADNGREVWTETLASAGALQIAAVIIWTVDAETRTLASGRYYSEVVQHDAQPISDFMKSLGIPQEGVSPKDRSTD